MNKKELRRLIKECFAELLKEGNLLTEKFASKKIAMIYKRLKGRDKDVFQKLHNSHGIAWDQVDASCVTKGADTKKGINFFFINKSIKNRYAKSSWDETIYGPNLLGITSGKSVLYAGANTLSSEKGSGWRWSKDPVGLGAKEMNNFKRMNQLADEIWNMHNPRPFPAKKYEFMQWEEDDFIKMKDGRYLLRRKQKADSELKGFMRKKVWIGVPKHY